MESPIVTRTDLTCPECGFVEELDIPLNYWLISHTCASCGTKLRPIPGDCCVFCSYGDDHCVSKQREALAKEKDGQGWHGTTCVGIWR